jgi:hypothetical protein
VICQFGDTKMKWNDGCISTNITLTIKNIYETVSISKLFGVDEMPFAGLRTW